MHWVRKVFQFSRKDKSSFVHGRYQAYIFLNSESDTNNENIQPGYRNGNYHREICYAQERIGQPNQENFKISKRP